MKGRHIMVTVAQDVTVKRCEHGVMVTGNCTACLALSETADELAWWDSLTAEQQAALDVQTADWWDDIDFPDFGHLTT